MYSLQRPTVKAHYTFFQTLVCLMLNDYVKHPWSFMLCFQPQLTKCSLTFWQNFLIETWMENWLNWLLKSVCPDKSGVNYKGTSTHINENTNNNANNNNKPKHENTKINTKTNTITNKSVTGLGDRVRCHLTVGTWAPPCVSLSTSRLLRQAGERKKEREFKTCKNNRHICAVWWWEI